MNLTLEQAMAQATRGPLIVHANRIQDLNTAQPLASLPRRLNESNEWEWLRPDVEANSALLAHWYNRGPELVMGLSRTLAALETPGDLTREEVAHVIEDMGELLARANTVAISD